MLIQFLFFILVDIDNDDQHSGIVIFSDGETKHEKLHEDGEILGEPRHKKSVEFPGINAPIPEKADERLWTVGYSRSDYSSRYRLHHRSGYSSEQTISRSYHGSDNTRWSREDYSRNYGGRSSLSSRGIPIPSPTSASGGGFQSEWDSWRGSSSWESEDSRNRGPYDSVSHSYPSSRSFERSRYEGRWSNEPRDSRDVDYRLDSRDESRRNYSSR